MIKFMKKYENIIKYVSWALLLCGLVMLTVGVADFLKLNAALIHNDALLTALFSVFLIAAYLALGFDVYKRFQGGKDSADMEKKAKIVKTALYITLFAAAFAIFLTILLTGAILDIFQPLALLTNTMVLLIVSVVILLAGLAAALAIHAMSSNKFSGAVVIGIMLICVMVTGMIWSGTQGFGEFGAIEGEAKFIFENGENGYATFRIPSLIALDKDILNDKEGLSLNSDVLVATAEARQNGARDLGKIDMVMKTSIDGGKTWSDLQILAEWKSEDGKPGKVGNPTAVFDRMTGKLVFVYMQTPLDKIQYLTYCIQGTVKNGGAIEWSEPLLLNENTDYIESNWEGISGNTIMCGPGKGVQLQQGDNAGRILIPCSNQGKSYALYSDDHGASWTTGSDAGEGNECEITELSNGELMMVVRENRGCSGPHPEQYQRMSFSNDGGVSWYKKTVDTTLKSPICMSSLATDINGVTYLTYPDDFFTRAALSYAYTTDNGASWSESKLVYGGAAGYSCLTADSEGNLYVLAEIGKVEYNEMLAFMKLSK